jgi:surface protein
MCGCIYGDNIKVSKNASIIEGILYIQQQDCNRDFVQIIEIAYIEGDEIKDYDEEVIIVLNKKKIEEINRNYNCYRIDGRIFKKLGKYDIKIIINPRLTYFSFHDNTNLLSVDLSKLKISNIKSMQKMFLGCTTLKEIKGINDLNTSNIEDMSSMFEKCNSLENIDLSSFDTSNVENMQLMFNECKNLKEIKGITNFKTNKVNNMHGMFSNCTKLEYIDLSEFDTSNTTNMKRMFYNCANLKQVNGLNDMFNVSKDVKMDEMLYGCKNLKDIDLSQLDPKIISEQN